MTCPDSVTGWWPAPYDPVLVLPQRTSCQVIFSEREPGREWSLLYRFSPRFLSRGSAFVTSPSRRFASPCSANALVPCGRPARASRRCIASCSTISPPTDTVPSPISAMSPGEAGLLGPVEPPRRTRPHLSEAVADSSGRRRPDCADRRRGDLPRQRSSRIIVKNATLKVYDDRKH